MAKRIMIVDDSSFMRKMVKNIIAAHGYEVVGEAKNGSEAVALYKELKPDLVTMDITMPDMNGIECLKAIRLIDPNARVIMISAMGQRVFLLDALKAGAIDYILKPFSKDRLLKAVKKALSKST